MAGSPVEMTAVQRRVSRGVASIGAVALMAVWAAGTAAAQTGMPLPLSGARSDADGQRAGARSRGSASAAPRLLPSEFGHPPGFGAGTTGFVSATPPASRGGTAPRRSPAPQPPPAADTRAARPGSDNTGPSRPGASIDVPAGTATPLIRRRRPPDDHPFDPLGIRAGAFLLRPAVEITGGYDTNASRVANGSGAAFVTVAPELVVRSDWSRHALNADLRGSYSAYPDNRSLDRPFFDGKVDGRLDITRHAHADAEARYLVSTDNPGSPDLPADIARLPIFSSVGGSGGVTQRFNRFEVSLKGSFDRTVYEDSQLLNGSTASNVYRNFNQYAGQARIAYELLPEMKPFAEVQYDHRIRDLEADNFGFRRSSRGLTARAGTTFAFSAKLTGEMSVGYALRRYEDQRLQDLQGLIADGALVWTASALTRVRLTARSGTDESTLPGVAGVLRRDAGIQVDHDFRRWLTATLRYGYGIDTYQGTNRQDQRQVAALAMTYRMNREIHWKGELRQEWLTSTVPGEGYSATVGLLGVRLQR